jgi:hypothetical protein
LSVTVSDATYRPGLANVTAPGVATALPVGEPPGNTQEYRAMLPSPSVPVPANVTAWPAAIVTSAEGLVMVPRGRALAGVSLRRTNRATDGTPAASSRKSM